MKKKEEEKEVKGEEKEEEEEEEKEKIKDKKESAFTHLKFPFLSASCFSHRNLRRRQHKGAHSLNTEL